MTFISEQETLELKPMEISVLELRRMSEAISGAKKIIVEEIQDIVLYCCGILNVKYNYVVSKTRERESAECRQVIMALLLEKNFTQKEIAEFFDRDHSTVIHARDKVNGTTFNNDRRLYRKMQILELTN